MILIVVIFAFQEDRTEKSYDKLFESINQLVKEKTGRFMDTELCVVDNERAMINSLRKIIDFESGRRELKLCAFHVNQGYRTLFRQQLCQEITVNGDGFNSTVYSVYVQMLKLHLLPVDISHMLIELITEQVQKTQYSPVYDTDTRIRHVLVDIVEKVKLAHIRNGNIISWHNIILNNSNAFTDTTNNRYSNSDFY